MKTKDPTQERILCAEKRKLKGLELTTNQAINLTMLHALMKDIPPDRFVTKLSTFLKDNYEKPMCGTVACAAGHAALHPFFKEQGLLFKFNSSSHQFFLTAERYIHSMAFLSALFGSKEIFVCQHFLDEREEKCCVLDRIKYAMQHALVIDAPFSKKQ